MKGATVFKSLLFTDGICPDACAVESYWFWIDWFAGIKSFKLILRLSASILAVTWLRPSGSFSISKSLAFYLKYSTFCFLTVATSSLSKFF